MSDTITLAIVAGVGSFLSALVGLLNTYLVRQSNQHLAAASRAISKQAEAMDGLEKNTNSMKDELVKVTAQAEFAKGLKKGTEDAAIIPPPSPEEPSHHS